MKTTIIAVRHGETEWNKSGRQQGHLNSDLTSLGVLQAQAMGEGLKGFTIDHFYSSDLGRAIQTSEIISKIICKDFVTDERLRERKLGLLQGLTKSDFAGCYPEEYKKFTANNPDYVIPNGESIADRFNRSICCIEDLSAKHQGNTILVVAHGGVLMSLMYRAMQIPIGQVRTFSLYNGSINKFSISNTNDWRLEIWGEINHLIAKGLNTIDDN